MSLLLAYALIGTADWALPPGPATARAPSPPSAAPMATAPQRDLALEWPEPVRLTIEPDPYEVVVRFDRPLAEEEITRFATAAGPLLADLRWNDDSIVLRPAAGNLIEAAAAGNTLRVRFIAEREPAPAPAPATATGPTAGLAADAVELELARAQADAATGYPGQARRRLARLADAAPADPQLQRALADAEVAGGALEPAARRYRALGADDRMARRAIAEADGRAAATFLVRDGDTFTQWEAGAEAMLRVRDGLMLGAGLRRVTTTAQDVASATGSLPRIHAEDTVASITAGVQLGAFSRMTAQLATLVDRPVTGGVVRLFAGSPERQVRLVAAYRLPDFSTAEQSWLGGHVTRLGGGGTLRLTPELVIQADASWNRYGLARSGGRTTSVTISGGADYLLLRGRPTVQLSYRLDAEYVRRMDLRPNGIPFIPLSERENHTVQAIFSLPLKTVQLTAAGGWTWDRKARTNGPTASLGLLANLGDAWRLEASGGVSSISRPAVSGRQLYLQLTLTRFLRR